MKTPEEILEENGYAIEDLAAEKTMLFRNPDFAEAIIGISDNFSIVYDYDKMVKILVRDDDISYEEAVEYIDCNVLKALPYCNGKAPIVIYKLIN